MNSIFLKAEWRNLILANYEFDRTILQKYLPAKTEFDTCHGKDYVSLVGFLFKNTKVKGIAFPFHTTFEEVNLRFYVRYKVNNEWRRGVVFIKEIVPKSIIAWIANTLYKEHYIACKMNHKWEFREKEKGEREKDDTLNVSYSWENPHVRHCGAPRSNLFQYSNGISVEVENKKLEIAVGSGEEFITEHYYGYSKFDEKITGEYKVEHPRWMVYPVMDYTIKCDFGKNYGSDFKSLTGMKPNSVYLAEGSEIKVHGKVMK